MHIDDHHHDRVMTKFQFFTHLDGVAVFSEKLCHFVLSTLTEVA